MGSNGDSLRRRVRLAFGDVFSNLRAMACCTALRTAAIAASVICCNPSSRRSTMPLTSLRSCCIYIYNVERHRLLRLLDVLEGLSQCSELCRQALVRAVEPAVDLREQFLHVSSRAAPALGLPGGDSSAMERCRPGAREVPPHTALSSERVAIRPT